MSCQNGDCFNIHLQKDFEKDYSFVCQNFDKAVYKSLSDAHTHIKKYDGLPFAMRWLEREFGTAKTRLGLRELDRAGIITSHPPLKEIANGLVAQSEHSILVADKPIITTKIED